MWSVLVCAQLSSVLLLGALALPSLPPYLTDFQGSYPEDFNSFLRTAKRYHAQGKQTPNRYHHGHGGNGGVYMGQENPQNEGDLRERFGLDNDLDLYDLYPRSEYPDANMLKSLSGEIKVTGGNGANGVFNNYPDSVIPEEQNQASKGDSSEKDELMHEIDEELSAAMQSGNAPEINPYPTPPNPCPLPYPDEDGKIRPYTVADDCLPQWADTVELSRWFQNQQVGKSDAEHNQGIDKGHVKKAAASEKLPSYMKAEEKREHIVSKKGR